MIKENGTSQRKQRQKMADMDELYADVFQIPLTSPKKSPIKRRSNHCLKARKPVKAYEKNIDENSVDIYSDLSLDSSYHHETAANHLKETDNKESSEVCTDNIQDNLDLYTDVMTSELLKKEKYKQELNKLRLENESLTVKNKQLLHMKEQLSKNISCLFLTAKKELEKKEEEMKQLRQTVEQLKKANTESTRDRCKSYVETKDIHKSLDFDIKNRQKPYDNEFKNRHKPYVEEPNDKHKSHVGETKGRHKSFMDETKDKHRYKLQANENKNKQMYQCDETRGKHLVENRDRQRSHIDETMNKRKSNADGTSNKPKSHDDQIKDKIKSLVGETRDKQKSYFGENRDTEKSYIDIIKTRDKQKSHDEETMDKQKSHADETRDKPKSHVGETRDKQKSHVDEIRDKQKSHVDETKDKQTSHVEIRDKQKSHVDETKDKQTSLVDESRDKQKSHVVETRDKQKSHVDETKDKQTSHVDETRDKQTSHVDESRDKQTSHVDESRDKQKSHVVETRDKQKSHVDETRNKQKTHVDEIRDDQKSHVYETRIEQKSQVYETRDKQKTHIDETRDEQKSLVYETSDISHIEKTSKMPNDTQNNCKSDWNISQKEYEKIQNCENDLNSLAKGNETNLDLKSNSLHSEDLKRQAGQTSVKQFMESKQSISSVKNVPVESLINLNQLENKRNQQHCEAQGFKNQNKDNFLLLKSGIKDSDISSNKSSGISINKDSDISSNKSSGISINKDSKSSDKAICISCFKDGCISSTKDSCIFGKKDVYLSSNQDGSFPNTTVVDKTYLKSPPLKKAKIIENGDSRRVVLSKSKTIETPLKKAKIIENVDSRRVVLSKAETIETPSQRSNKNILTSETSSSCFTNQTWPFQVSAPSICESSKDMSDITEKHPSLESRSKHERAFPFDKVSPVSQSRQMSSSFIDVEDLGDSQEADCYGNYHKLEDLPSPEPGQILPGTHRLRISTVVDNNTLLIGDKPILSEKQSPSHDPNLECNLPFTSFATKKSKSKSDDSIESEMTKSHSSSQDTDSDKQSQSSEEFSKKNKSGQIESPVPYPTSIICTSNLILLGDEETTCTTFVSPSKPHYLPSEFYPPGVRAPVQVEKSHARHIRGPPEIIKKSHGPAPHLPGNHSSSVTDPLSVSEQYIFSKHNTDFEKIESDEMLVDAFDEAVNPVEPKRPKPHFDSQTVQDLGVLKSHKINWKSLVEETFHQVFQKELKTFKEYNVLYSHGGQKLYKHSKAEILEKKMDLVRRCRPQSRIAKNLEVSGKLMCGNSASSVVSSISATHNSAVNNTHANSVETEGNDKILKQPCESVTVGYNCRDVYVSDCQPRSVIQDSNSNVSSALTSSDHLASAHRKPGHPVHVRKFDHEADSTSESQNSNLCNVSHYRPVIKDTVTAFGEKHCSLDSLNMRSNLPAQLSSSEDDMQEEEAKENRSAQGSPSLSPYKSSRPNKTCSPLKPRRGSVMRREGSLVNVAGKSSPDEALNKTFTISPESDAVYDDEDDVVFLNTRDAKYFEIREPHEEISLMDASLSEFDSDVRKTPNKGGKHLQIDLGSSPIYFRNKINPKNVLEKNSHIHFIKQSPGSSKNTCKSPRLNMKNSDKLTEFKSTMEISTVDPFQTRKTVSCNFNLNEMPTTDLHSELESVVCCRQKTFQELKDSKLVNSKYVYVKPDDDSDQDWQKNEEGHHLNEEVIEYIKTVQKVKKKLDLNSSPAMSSPFIQVSDSLTSPPTRQNLNESRMSARKMPIETKESLLSYASIENNETMISRDKQHTEDVEEGEILDGQDDKHQQASETVSRIDELKPRSDKDNEKNGKNDNPASQPQGPDPDTLVDKNISVRLNPRLTVTAGRKRSRSKTPESKRKPKYYRSESGQKLSQESSENNSLERERRNDSSKNERKSSRELDRDKRSQDDRRNYCNRNRDRQHISSRDSFESNSKPLEIKSRSSSRHERNRLSDDDSDREKRQNRLETKPHYGSNGGDKRRQHADEAGRSRSPRKTNGNSLYHRRENSYYSSSHRQVSRPQNSKSRRD